MSKRNKPSNHRVCCFCGLSEDNELEFGKFYEHGDIVTHYYCLLLSSNMEQKGNDDEGILGFLEFDIQKELRRGKRLVCSYCKKNGATLGCCNVRCKRIFHYPCGLRAGTLNQFFGEFRSFCINHRPKQKIDIQVRKEVAKTSEVVCYICYDNVNARDVINTTWAPCCKKNAWFHRKCVQQLAVSAGYFFKCPLCNDKKSFQKAMLEFGIFIPSQDASWELVPNAFQELLHRHDQCDAPICLCPKGRKHTSFNAKWELTLCRTCGSQGIHMACGQLKWGNPAWECTDCSSILCKSKRNINLNTTTLQNDSDSEDTDSDISVGKDSPIPFTTSTSVFNITSDTSTTELRPGPQTFKLQQLKEAKEIQSIQLKSTSMEQITQQTDKSLELSHVEETTSIKKAVATSNSSLTDTVSWNCKEYTNLLPVHSKSLSASSVNKVTIFDSDNDIKEVTNENNTFTVANANEVKTNDVSELKNIKYKEKNSSPLMVGKLLETNNCTKSNDNNSLTNSLNVTVTHTSNEFSSQEMVESDILEETMDLNQEETDYACVDFLSNIKIMNVMSLAPEEFEKVPSTEEARDINDIEYLIPKNNNESLNNASLSQSLITQSGTSDTSLKRKFNNAVLNSSTSPIDTLKKMKKNDPHKKEQQSSSNFEDVKNTKDFTLNTIASVSNLKNRDKLYAQVQEDSTANEDIIIEHVFNVNRSLHENSLLNTSINNENNVSTVSSKYREKNNGTTIACNTRDMVETNQIFEFMKSDTHSRNCDGDASTSLATQSEKVDFTNDTKKFIKSDYSHSESNKSDILDQWESQGDIEMTSNSASNQRKSRTECNYPQLISEFVRLRDLKFRVYNSNSLQMILYDKFFVNINMESATTTKNSKSDVFTRKIIQQKPFKIQSETASNLKSEDIFFKDKNKHSSLISDQPNNYRDDTKENLDPIVTTSYKNIVDTPAINNSNQCEVDNSSQSMYSMCEVIDDNNRLPKRETVNLINNIDNIFNAEKVVSGTYTTMSLNDKHFRNVNEVRQNVQSLSSAHVTNSVVEKCSGKVDVRNDSHDTTKFFQRDSCFEDNMNHITKHKSGNIDETRCKVSIDLKKVENFIDNNPCLFSKFKNDNDEQHIDEINFSKEKNNIADRTNLLSRPVANLVTDETKLGNFTLSAPKDGMKELKNCINKNDKNIEDLITTDDLVQKIKHINNSSSYNHKRNLKYSSNHSKKQCTFNR